MNTQSVKTIIHFNIKNDDARSAVVNLLKELDYFFPHQGNENSVMTSNENHSGKTLIAINNLCKTARPEFVKDDKISVYNVQEANTDIIHTTYEYDITLCLFI